MTRRVSIQPEIWSKVMQPYKLDLDHCVAWVHALPGYRFLSCLWWLWVLGFTYFCFILLLHSLRFSLMYPASLFYAIYLPWSLDFVIILFLIFYQCFILLFYQCFKFYFNCFRVYPCRGPRWAETLDVSIVC